MVDLEKRQGKKKCISYHQLTCFLRFVIILVYTLDFFYMLSLYLKWVSYRQHVVRLCFESLWQSVLIGAFRTLTLKVIIDIVGFLSTILPFSIYCPYFLFLFLSFALFLPFVVLIKHFIWFYFFSFLSISIILKKKQQLFIPWPGGWNIIPYIKRLWVWFPIRAHTWVAGSIPS